MQRLSNDEDRSSRLHALMPGRPAFAALLISAVGALAYANSLHVPFQYDDNVVIIGEPAITGFHLDLARRRFLGDLSFALSYRWFGERTFGYHVINLVIHLLNALLVGRLVRLLWRTAPLTRSALAGRAEIIALLSALLFVAHPIQTQAVTYIVQRYASLATLFFLASTVSYLAFRLARSARAAAGWYATFLLSAGAACWTKENALVLPLVVAALELIFLTAPLRRRVLYLSPFLAVAAVGVVAAFASGMTLARLDAMTRVDTDMARGDYFLTQLRVVATYLRLILVPVGQNLDHDVAVSHAVSEPSVLLAAALHVALLATGGVALDSGARGDGIWRVVGFGVVWFYATLLVESSFIPIVDVIYEHRVYLPSVGVFVAAVAAAVTLRSLEDPRRFVALAATVVVTLGSFTVLRNRVWRSREALWADAAEKSPAKARPINNLGIAVLDRGDPQLAAKFFERAIRLDPSYSKAYFNLGEARSRGNDCQGAIPPLAQFRAWHPSFPETYRLLADCYERLGRSAEAKWARDAFASASRQQAGRALPTFYR